MPTGGGTGGGLATVSTNTTLAGNGTSGSPLGVKNWPLTFFTPCAVNGTSGINGANKVDIYGFALDHALTFANISIYIDTSDSSNNYDFGIYSDAGSLVANVGAQTLPSTGQHGFATVQGSQTILPGNYLFAVTGVMQVAVLYFSNSFLAWKVGLTYANSTGGALPSSITAPTVAPALSMMLFGLF